MNRGPYEPTRFTYRTTLAMLALAFLFPIGLMIGNPTLMFKRGWEQFVGTGIYIWAVVTLMLELRWLWKNEQGISSAGSFLAGALEGKRISSEDDRILPSRLRQLATHTEGSTAKPTMDQLIQINQEASGLDQEQAAGRFTLTKYILYLLPVIGFIGTVEGISKALMNISRVLPMVRDLDGFLTNLTSVTSALQIAFDSTLLALFLSAALMLVQTLVFRRSEDLLARVDRWIVEQVLPKLGGIETVHSGLHLEVAAVLGPYFERLEMSLSAHASETRSALETLVSKLGDGLKLGENVDRFSNARGAFAWRIHKFPTRRRGVRTRWRRDSRIGPGERIGTQRRGELGKNRDSARRGFGSRRTACGDSAGDRSNLRCHRRALHGLDSVAREIEQDNARTARSHSGQPQRRA